VSLSDPANPAIALAKATGTIIPQTTTNAKPGINTQALDVVLAELADSAK